MTKCMLLLLVLALWYAPAYAQSNGILVLLFERSGSVYVDDFIIGNTSLQDANGDGVPDLTLQRTNEQGHLQDLRVLDGRTYETIWEVHDVQGLYTDGGDAALTLHGFVDTIGTNTPYALFSSSEDVFLVDLNDNSEAFRTLAPSPSVLSGVVDVTGDGRVDLIISQPEAREVQGYYAGQATVRF